MAINLSFTFQPPEDCQYVTQEILDKWANNQDVIDIYTVEYVCGYIVCKPSYKFIDLSSHKNIDVLLQESFKEFLDNQIIVVKCHPEIHQDSSKFQKLHCQKARPNRRQKLKQRDGFCPNRTILARLKIQTAKG